MLSAPLVHGAYQGGPSFEPAAHLAMDFRRGRYRHGPGRGRLASTPLALPSFTSIGGAGFGRVQRSGIWVPIAANEPLIGDDGLEGWEGAQNLNAQSGELTIENGWALSTGSPPVRTSGHFLAGLRATRFVTPIEMMGYRVYDDTNAVWISPIGGNNTATPYAPGRISISIVAPAGCTALRIYPLRSQDNSTWTYKTFAVTPGQTYTARWVAAKNGNDYYIAAFGFRPGRDVGDPPVETGALPAARTSTDYRVSNLAIQPEHYGVARLRWDGQPGTDAGTFPAGFELTATGGSGNRILWRKNTATNSHAITFRVDGPTIATIGFGDVPTLAGAWRTVAWRSKAGAYAASLDGGVPIVSTAAQPMPVMVNLGLLGSSVSSGQAANGKMSDFVVWNGNITDSDLQALASRYTYA